MRSQGLIYSVNFVENHTESNYSVQPCREPRRKQDWHAGERRPHIALYV
jgi:hypothetical protein